MVVMDGADRLLGHISSRQLLRAWLQHSLPGDGSACVCEGDITNCSLHGDACQGLTSAKY